MNQMVLWDTLCAVAEPHYPKKGNGRPPIGLGRMLRIHFLQHWVALDAGRITLLLTYPAVQRLWGAADLGCDRRHLCPLGLVLTGCFADHTDGALNEFREIFRLLSHKSILSNNGLSRTNRGRLIGVNDRQVFLCQTY
jgi:hypothetical protein